MFAGDAHEVVGGVATFFHGFNNLPVEEVGG